MDVYWLEQNEADLPVHNDWLSANEAARIDGMGFARRRTDWRLGRWTAKRALALYWELAGDPQGLQQIEIQSAPSGAPVVFFGGQPAAVTISLSHRAGIAACAVARSGAALGCDLEIAEPRSDAFVGDYFTAEEQALVARASPVERPYILALLWSAKESALKALGTGLRLDTRCAAVSLEGFSGSRDLNGWRPLHVRYAGGGIFHGWWQCAGDLVRTLAAAPAPVIPISLTCRRTLAPSPFTSSAPAPLPCGWLSHAAPRRR